jgi:hypothetical protein
MAKQTVYLVIRADRSVRAAKRPRLAADEVAISVTLEFPETWGRVIDSLRVAVPDFAPSLGDRTHDEIAAEKRGDDA